MKTVDGLYHEMKNTCPLYKIEHTSTDPQPCLRKSSNSLCNGLVLRSHRAVEIEI